MATTDSASNFVTQLWTKSANDKLKTTDVYSDPNGGVISPLPAIKTSLDSVKSGLSSIKSIAGSVKSAIGDIKAFEANLKSGNLLDRVINSSGAVKGLLVKAGLGDGQISQYLDTAKSVAVMGKSSYDQAQAIIAEVKAFKFNDMHAVANLIGGITGIPDLNKLVDSATEVAVGVTAMKKYLSLGGDSAGTYNAILGTLSKTEDQVQLTSYLMPTVISTSALYTLRSIDQNLGTGRLVGLYPKVIRDFVAGLTVPAFTTPEQEKAYFNDLISTLYTIDPNWNSGVHNGISVFRVTDLLNGSKDFKKLVADCALSTVVNGQTAVQSSEQLMLTAKLFTETTVMADLKARFGSTVVAENTIARDN